MPQKKVTILESNLALMRYVAFSPDAEISGSAASVMFSYPFPYIYPSVRDIMAEEGLVNIESDKWYSQQKCLNVLEKIEDIYGSYALYLIGRFVIEEINNLPVTDLEADLIYIDTNYEINHRNGELGYFDLLEFDNEKQYAKLEIFNAYPEYYDKGVIEAVLRKHISIDTKVSVTELERIQKKNGRESTVYEVKWYK